MHHKKPVLPLHRIKMVWNGISRPIYDRGFDWMAILCDLEFRVIRLPQDLQKVLLVSLHSVMMLLVMVLDGFLA